MTSNSNIIHLFSPSQLNLHLADICIMASQSESSVQLMSPIDLILEMHGGLMCRTNRKCVAIKSAKMVQCSALNCTVRSGQGISMFLYPKEPSRRKLWVSKVKRKDFQPSKHARLCEKHFVESDFKISRTFATSLGYPLKELQLKEDVVPTVFEYQSPENDERKRKPARLSNAREKRRKLEYHKSKIMPSISGIYKKLIAAGKKKGCESVGLWARSVSNHLYWCAASSEGDSELITQKWLSLLNHVTNKHDGHGDRYPCCEHEPIDDRIWLKKGFKPYHEVEAVVKQNLLLKDIKRLSPAEQTSSLEAFHKVICHFAPKFVHYQHAQMEARLYLAVLHFNENSNRDQAVNQDGEPIYSISFPKGRGGDGIVKEKRVQQTFDYVDDLMEELILRREVNYSYTQARMNSERRIRPLPLSANCEQTPKVDIVNRHVKRFNIIN